MMYSRESAFSERDMLVALTSFAAQRHEKHHHVLVDHWPSLAEMDENVFVGSFSWLGVSSHTRWIKRSTAINVGGYLSTPGDVARNYLTLKYTKRKRITADQKLSIYQHRSHPLYANPIRLVDGSYVDIKSAYWSIMSIVGWDVDYFPGRWLSPGVGMSDFPYRDHKLSRNCLVTAGLGSTSKMWMHERKRLAIKKIGNRFANMQLWSLVMDVLNGVACDVKEKVFYVHTDGYICDTEDAADVQERIRAWGLPSRIKHRGDTRIQGAGQYRVGEKSTKLFPNLSRDMLAIYQPDRSEALRTWISKLAKFADPPIAYEQ